MAPRLLSRMRFGPPRTAGALPTRSMWWSARFRATGLPASRHWTVEKQGAMLNKANGRIVYRFHAWGFSSRQWTARGGNVRAVSRTH
jgi:hypothetical protein